LKEAEHKALRRHLGDAPRVVSSALVLVEVTLAVRRAIARSSTPGLAELMAELLGGIHLFRVDPRFLWTAGMLEPLTVRALDAIHVATGLAIKSRLESFVTYDRRQIEAARLAGLPVISPA